MAPEQSREPALTANTADQTAQVVESAQPNKASQREDGEVAESDRDSLLAPASKVSAAERLNAMTAASDPPLPYDEAPPEDDGWTCYMDYDAGAYKFYNRYTGVYQWENPRVPEATAASSYGSYDRYANSSTAVATTSSAAPGTSSPPKRVHGGYNPAIHGSYDPNADYAKEAEREEEEMDAAVAAAAGLPTAKDEYATTAHFNRFNGRFQQPGLNPEYHNDENKSKRQMNAFFDVDAAANSHQGRSLKAERRSKTLSKKELKAFQSKRRDKKEEKRRAWLTKD